MIIAGRNRGRIHATSATLQSTTIGGRHGAHAPSPAPCPPPEQRSASELREALERLRSTPPSERFRRHASRFSLRATALGIDTQAAIPLVLLGLAVTAFIPGAHFELQSASDLSAVETAATLISALAAV
ncbi:MAG TPA: hypothetical protein VGI76_05525, partial [Solirubrobacteraceae bacterium]